LYVAFTIYLLGWGAIVGSVCTIGIVLPGFVLFWSFYALAHEERVLARRFGEDFSNYKRETPFFLRFRRTKSGPGILFSLTYLLGKVLFRVVFPMKVEGRERLPQTGPAVIVANHACYLDPIFLTAASNRFIRFLTTAEMMRTRAGRWLFTRFGSIPIRRYASDPGAVRKLFACLRGGEIVGIFPEGERSWDGNPLSIAAAVRKLLARLDVPIVPARIEESYAILPRWAKIPLPGRIRVCFFPPRIPPFSKEDVTDILGLIAVQSDGQTRFTRSVTGIERLLWACPNCSTIGSITAHRQTIRCKSCQASWTIDRQLILCSADGSSTPLADISAVLSDGELFQAQRTLLSIGRVDLLRGSARLQLVASGQARYEGQELHVGSQTFPVQEIRSLTTEGNTRLDLGFGDGRRLRLSFLHDSPLKWQRFLGLQLGIAPWGGNQKKQGSRSQTASS
jgi:1-acyl-sn-glycerol-3-phosphate acyltransferase